MEQEQQELQETEQQEQEQQELLHLLENIKSLNTANLTQTTRISEELKAYLKHTLQDNQTLETTTQLLSGLSPALNRFEALQQAKVLFEIGLSYGNIEKITGISKATLYRHAKKEEWQKAKYQDFLEVKTQEAKENIEETLSTYETKIITELAQNRASIFHITQLALKGIEAIAQRGTQIRTIRTKSITGEEIIQQIEEPLKIKDYADIVNLVDKASLTLNVNARFSTQKSSEEIELERQKLEEQKRKEEEAREKEQEEHYWLPHQTDSGYKQDRQYMLMDSVKEKLKNNPNPDKDPDNITDEELLNFFQTVLSDRIEDYLFNGYLATRDPSVYAHYNKKLTENQLHYINKPHIQKMFNLAEAVNKGKPLSDTQVYEACMQERDLQAERHFQAYKEGHIEKTLAQIWEEYIRYKKDFAYRRVGFFSEFDRDDEPQEQEQSESSNE